MPAMACRICRRSLEHIVPEITDPVVCSTCSLHNERDNVFCTCCKTALENPQEASSEEEEDSSDDEEEEGKRPGFLICKICTYKNDPDDLACSMCTGVLRVEGLPEPERKEPLGVTCPSCTFQNPDGAGACEVCGIHFNEERKVPLVVEHEPTPVVCDNCTFKNGPGDRVCTMCCSNLSRSIVEEKKEVAEVPTCAICMEELAGKNATTTPCYHVFCSPCIGKWWTTPGNKNMCPVCRADCSEVGGSAPAWVPPPPDDDVEEQRRAWEQVRQRQLHARPPPPQVVNHVHVHAPAPLVLPRRRAVRAPRRVPNPVPVRAPRRVPNPVPVRAPRRVPNPVPVRAPRRVPAPVPVRAPRRVPAPDLNINVEKFMAVAAATASGAATGAVLSRVLKKSQYTRKFAGISWILGSTVGFCYGAWNYAT